MKAAEQGDVKAQAAIAMLYANGKGVQQNYAEAGKWWIKAAEGGDLKPPPGTPGICTGTAKAWSGTRRLRTNGRR